MRSASAKPGKTQGGWSPATPPARRAGDEIRAPATLVEAISHAITDVGSIPTVSTGTDRSEEARISHPDAGFRGREGAKGCEGKCPVLRVGGRPAYAERSRGCVRCVRWRRRCPRPPGPREWVREHLSRLDGSALVEPPDLDRVAPGRRSRGLRPRTTRRVSRERRRAFLERHRGRSSRRPTGARGR